jgi:IS5 family transposase
LLGDRNRTSRKIGSISARVVFASGCSLLVKSAQLDQERQSVVLPHEGAYRRGHRIRAGTHSSGADANGHDIVKADALLHGKQTVVYGDAQKRTNAKAVEWMVAMCPGKRVALDKNDELDRIVNEIEYLKASVCAKVEHPFRVIKLQFGFVKVRYRGLKKNTAQLTMLFALSNLWTARRKLLKM